MATEIKPENFAQAMKDIFQKAQKKSLKILGEYGIREFALIFRSEGRDFGTPWVPLNEKYRKSKIRHGFSENILKKTGALAQSFGYTVANDKDSVFIGTPVKYAPFMEYGTSRGIPPRPFLYPVGKHMIKEGLPGISFLEAMHG